jgi:hypothetical protein
MTTVDSLENSVGEADIFIVVFQTKDHNVHVNEMISTMNL